MAVAVEVTLPGATLELYDEIVAASGFTPGGPGAPGCLFHWVTQTYGGLRVVDVWSSREVFVQFAEETIRPSLEQAGYEQEPEISVSEVHNYMTAG